MTGTLLSPRGRILIFVMMEGPATRKMLQERASLSDRSVERILGDLQEAGLVGWSVTRVGGPKWWAVKEGIEVAEALLHDAQS
jgi:hypothetical protein